MTIRTFLRLFAHVQMLPILESGEETLVGGQAVMEGVMMRAPHSYCVAVRKPSGEIVTEEMPVARVSEKRSYFKWPILRGLGTLGQAMQLGMHALKFSANAALGETTEAAAEPKPAVSGWMMNAQVVFSVLFFIVLYKLVPLKLTEIISNFAPAIKGQILFNLVDGLIRIAIFLGFLFMLSRSKDIRRVFEYHGAEHKVVFNFESGKPVNISNAQSFVTWHPRCGTSFMFVIMLISMIVYMFIPVQGFAAKFAIRVALLPLIAGLSYGELIRFAAKRRGSFLSILTAPGLWTPAHHSRRPRLTNKPKSPSAPLDGAMAALEARQGGELVIA